MTFHVYCIVLRIEMPHLASDATADQLLLHLLDSGHRHLCVGFAIILAMLKLLECYRITAPFAIQTVLALAGWGF
jgi:hypothetical protein